MEQEIFLYDILDGEFVDTMVHKVGTKHVECSFIEERSPNSAISIKRNVIATGLIHQNAKSGIWSAINQEIQSKVWLKVIISFFIIIIW